MPWDVYAGTARKTAANIPENAVGIFELQGQSNAFGTNSLEAAQDLEFRELWQGIEDNAWIWSRIKSAFNTDPDTVNLGSPVAPELAVDQWRPMTTGYGLQGVKPWLGENDNVGPERVIAWWLHSFFRIPIYCLKVCRGGTSLLNSPPDEWDFHPDSAPKDPGIERMWDVWNLRYRVDALPALRAQVGPGVPVYHLGHVWIHGTKDAQIGADADTYGAALTRLIETYRDEVPNVPVAITRLQNYALEDGSYFSNLNDTPVVRAQQQAVADSTPFCEISDTDSAERNPGIDAIHFSGRGLVNVGIGAAHSLMSIDNPVLLPI